jgi:hypothetical protein
MQRLLILIASLLAVLAVPSAASAALSFAPAPGSPFTTADEPEGVALADFNRDGRQDVLVGQRDSTKVTVFLAGNGGTLAPAPGSPLDVGHNLPVAVATADLNTDGNPDAISAAAVGNNGKVAVLLGDGKGGLTPAPGSPYATTAPGPNSGQGIGIADIDDDGTLDVVVAGDTKVTLLRGTGTGALGAPAVTTLPNNLNATAGSLVVGDFTGDGKPDVVTGDPTPPRVSLILRYANGALSFFASKVNAGDRPVAGDLDGDGRLDLAMTDTGPDEADVFLVKGAGVLNPAPGSPFDIGLLFAWGTNLTDLDADGRLDLSVAAQGGVDLYRGLGTGGFSQFSGAPLAGATFAKHVAAGDVNGDGQPDLVVADTDADRVFVHLNQNAGGASAPAAADFGAALAGGGAIDRTVTLTSTGTGFLRVDSASPGGPAGGDYSVTSDGCSGRSLIVGQSCDIGLRFAAGAAGPRAATLTVADNAGGHAVALTGSGIATSPPPGPAKDTTRPSISRLRLSAGRFAVGTKRGGTRISYSLSEAATVRIAIERATGGRKKGKSCAKPTKALKRAKKCTRYVRAGTLTAKSKKGTTKLAFDGRVSKKLLGRGGYRIVVTAVDAAGNRTKSAATKRFTIIKAKKK